MTVLAQVAVPVPVLGTLTYRVPPEIERPAKGARVLVPLGTRRLTGCVISTSEPDDGAELPVGLRDVIDLLDPSPFLPETVVDLALWVAEYYAASPGEALALAMPPMAWVASRRLVRLTAEGEAVMAGSHGASLTPVQSAALRLAGSSRPVPFSTLAARLAKDASAPSRVASPIPVNSVVRSLERAGLITVSQALAGDPDGSKMAAMVVPTAQGLDLAIHADRQLGDGRPALEVAGVRGERQRDLLARLRLEPQGLSLAQLRRLGLASDVVHRLARRGLVAVRQIPVERDPFTGPWGMPSDWGASTEVPELTSDQIEALKPLRALSDRDSFHVALLHGVTGSGKTELYLRLADDVLRRRKRVLVLVPEIALTPALAHAFRTRFRQGVAVQHSGLSDGERHDQWQAIRRGEIDIVVGTRSAVMAPIDDLGLVVVDEEHDASYKQDESPRYHGRDVAIMRARQAGALVVLGSATPSLESYTHAKTGRYLLVQLGRRILDRPLASVTIVNMRREFAECGPGVILSRALRTAIGDRLARREQTLVLQNRRGFATSVFCRECGGTTECPNCSVSLVAYKRGAARCHYCGYERRIPSVCPACGGPYMEQAGFGTERVEAEISEAFPAARIARLDRDSARRRGAVTGLLGRLGRGEIDVLVGTQMIAKGHDFPRVTLVGVVSADVGLGLADFRAAERTFQLLTQVIGRAGRGDIAGDAIVQSLCPEHYSIALAARQDYAAFAEAEAAFRRAMRYPPEFALINIVVKGASHASAMDAARDIARLVAAESGSRGAFTVLGPAPAPLTRLRGEHRAQLFVKGRPARRVAMREAVMDAVAKRTDLRRRITIDVDPLTVL